MATDGDAKGKEGVDAEEKAENGVKMVRSYSVLDTPLSEVTDGRFPPVLVMCHPTMKKMATRLVQATKSRMLRLNQQSDVSSCCLPACVWIQQIHAVHS